MDFKIGFELPCNGLTTKEALVSMEEFTYDWSKKIMTVGVRPYFSQASKAENPSGFFAFGKKTIVKTRSIPPVEDGGKATEEEYTVELPGIKTAYSFHMDNGDYCKNPADKAYSELRKIIAKENEQDVNLIEKV